MSRVTTKGQVTIPAEIRKRYGLLPHSEVEIIEEGGKVVITLREGGGNRGERIAEKLRGRLKGKAKMTTEELMALTRGEDDGTFR